MHYLPDGIEAHGRDGVIQGSDGKLWPVPHLIKMDVGDAVMVHHACPHSASWNLWSEPRVMVYLFVIRSTVQSVVYDLYLILFLYARLLAVGSRGSGDRKASLPATQRRWRTPS